MITTCLVNSYNYAEYIGEAIASALDQTRPFDEIIVVDDGSTDNSLAVIETAVGGRSDVRVIKKENEGQLSCFNEGFLAASGDLFFFLDADDLYTPRYLETAIDFYDQNEACEFLACAVHEFGTHDSVKHYIDRFCEQTGDLGFSLLRTLYGKQWLGSATSSISARRSVLEQFLPLPMTQEWKTNADDCLVYGASLVGARKYYLPEPLVKYRVHENNNWYGRTRTKSYKYKKRLKIQKMMQYIIDKNHFNGNADDLILREFLTIPNPNLDDTRFFLGLLRNARLYPQDKRAIRNKIVRKYLKTRFGHLQLKGRG